jgi:hypothetical protein
MDFKLVFTKSGDIIKLHTDNPDLLMYYIDSVNVSKRNNFTIYCKNFLDNLVYLKECILQIDEYFVNKFKFTHFTEFKDVPLHNQKVLNRLHMVWVKFQLQNPNITNLLYKIDQNLLVRFGDINNIVHDIESKKFKICNFDSYKMWSCENILGKNIINFNNYNVKIEFNNLGRSTYDKWKHNDNNIYDSDTNDYTLLSGELTLSTSKPYTQSAPLNYTKYCTSHNLSVIGNTIGLGNFVEDVNVVQDILYRNIKNGSDSITIQI